LSVLLSDLPRSCPPPRSASIARRDQVPGGGRGGPIVAPQAREVIDVDGIRALFDGVGPGPGSNTQRLLVLRFEGRDEAPCGGSAA